jgi:hypothetical protein
MRVTSRKIASTITMSALALALVLSGAPWRVARAQESFPKGQNVVPVYEGWLPNPDGSFDLVFGYFNRNFEEELDVPVGADNTIEPGDPDHGQPTHFYPRRSRFQFHIRVPKDFGTKEIIWTLTTHGKTERAYGTLGCGRERRRRQPHRRQPAADPRGRGREEPNRQGRRSGDPLRHVHRRRHPEAPGYSIVWNPSASSWGRCRRVCRHRVGSHDFRSRSRVRRRANGANGSNGWRNSGGVSNRHAVLS